MRQGSSGRRPRGRSHRKQHVSPRTATYDSNGPEGRVRGNAHQVYDKYLALARDATAAGDRVAAEGFYQFAEHYFRLVNDSTDPHPDGEDRSGHGRDGSPRGGAASASDGDAGGSRAGRGNGAARDSNEGKDGQEGEGAPSAASSGGEPPRRRGLRRRRPSGGNGASAPEDREPQEMESADGDSDVVCS